MKNYPNEKGNVLLCALCTILVVSAIAGTVLVNCTTRYNVSSSQVQSWKTALVAAEAGGDLAFAEVRKTILDPSNAFPLNNGNGWTSSGGVYVSPNTAIGGSTASTASSRVDTFFTDSSGNPWYRIRAKGVTAMAGLGRTGMDDRMITGARGDSLLRKIDFKYDHYTAAYGPNGDGVGKALVAVGNTPQLARHIELIAAPLTPFEAAIKCSGTFTGLGNAAQIDSFNSANGPYYFCANNPSDPHYNDSRQGSVEIGSAVATVRGMLYGDIATNGGTIVRSSQITGTIDNNVPMTIPPYTLPTNLPIAQASPNNFNGNSSITPATAGSAANPTYYSVTGWSGSITFNQAGSAQTYVAVHVTGDITGKIDVKPGVHLVVYFDGNVSVKARDIVNENNLAANLQFYGISPTNPSTAQTITIQSPGDFAATFYAPGADLSINGNPDINGAVVAKSFYGNGNVSWHYDRALNSVGDAVDYRIASYVEDLR